MRVLALLSSACFAASFLVAQGAPVFPRIRHVPRFSGIFKPTQIANAGDGSGRLFFLEQEGRIRVASGGSLLTEPFLDIGAKVSKGSEQGLLGIAFPPGFSTKRYFYLNYTDLAGHTVIARYRVSSSNPDRADAASEQILITIQQPQANHNGGQILFSPRDGHLYVGMGDGGGGGDPQNNAQNDNTFLGKLLRWDIENGAPAPRIWAKGLRNPWRFSFDRLTGDLYIGDVGQGAREEINFQPATSSGGENYGWNVLEGSSCYLQAGCSTTGFTLPVAEYGRGDGQSVTGGFVYRGLDYPALRGFYFYGDFGTGRIWALIRSGGQWFNQAMTPGSNISTFGESEDGALYYARYFTGEIFEIVSDHPSAVSVTPAAGSGAAQTFEALFTGSGTFTTLDRVYLLLNSTLSGAGACFLEYSRGDDLLRLANDGATNWLPGGVRPGTAATIENSQCRIEGASSSVTATGARLYVRPKLVFKSPFLGARNVYAFATGSSANSGWQQLGAWTATGTTPPAAVQVTPAQSGNASQTFRFVFSDGAGAANLSRVYGLINGGLQAPQACFFEYDRQAGVLRLANDSATDWAPAALSPGSAGGVSNSQCSISGIGLAATQSGDWLILDVPITAQAAFSGTRRIFGFATDLDGNPSAWTELGVWTPFPNAPPVAASVTPNNGSGSSQTFQFTFSDANGAADIRAGYALINATLNAVNGCFVEYNRVANVLRLANDAASDWLPSTLTPGSAGVLSNSHCTVNGAGSSVNVTGNTLTLNLAVTFSAAFSGSRAVFGFVTDNAGVSSSWTQLGSWLVP